MKKFTFKQMLAIVVSIIMYNSALAQFPVVAGTNTSSEDDNVFSHTVNLPSGIQNGDLLLIFWADRDHASTLATPSGWTQLYNTNNNNYRAACFYKIANGSEGSTLTMTVSGDDERSTHNTYRIQAGSYTGIPVASSSATGSSTSPNPPNLTTASSGNYLWLAASHSEGGATVSSAPSNFTNLISAVNTSGTGNSNRYSIMATARRSLSTQSLDPGSFTISQNRDWSSYTVAILGQALTATAVLTPSVSVNAVANIGLSMTAVATNFVGSGNYTFDWTAVGGTISGTDPISQASATSTKTITFSSAGSYTVNVTISRTGASTLVTNTVTVNVSSPPSGANLWASSSDGTQISSYSVLHGNYFAGPTNIFAPTFPGTTTSGTTTAAIGRSQTPTQASGAFYWLPNTSGNNGVVEVFGATSTGGTPTKVAQLDVNGSGTNSLGFVRLAMGPDGTGWILAGDGSTVYLARFTPTGANGLGPATISVEDNSVTLVGGAASTFQNGDLCLDGQGGIYALANDGASSGSVTQIFIGTPNGNSTTLTKQWDVQTPGGAGFTNRVNGVAFDQFGSLYLTSDDGLYYINQATVDGPAATVQASLVHSQTGLQDLASNFFPAETTLPVTLLSFTASLRNDVSTINWVVENEVNFSHYELERSTSVNGFSSIATKSALGTTGRSDYQHVDNIASVSTGVAFYRLKMVDIDGKFKYSNVIMVRKGEKAITGIAVNPNPVVSSDAATIRFSTNTASTVAIRVIDMNGKVVLQQQNKVYEGVNSVPVNNLVQLLPGNYVIQLINGVEQTATKFTVIR